MEASTGKPITFDNPRRKRGLEAMVRLSLGWVIKQNLSNLLGYWGLFKPKREVKTTMIYAEIIQTFKNAGAALQSVEGELFYTPSDQIPEHCLHLAKEYKTRILAILDGKDLSAQWKRDNLFIQVMYFYRNIPDKSNDRIEEWLNHDDDAAKLFTKLTAEYESCGWQDIQQAPFNYENETSHQLLNEFYLNAVEFFKKERVAS